MNPNVHDPAALVSCDSEEIHLLGAIQPIGFLLSISSDWMILRASTNASTMLGLFAEIIGQPAANVLSTDLLHDIRGRLQIAAGTGIVERLFGYRLATGLPRYDIAVHVSGAETILEFEASTGETSAPLSILRSMMARTERQISVKKICDEAARQVRALTQFDRVMVYRFDADGAGEVVAESAHSNLTPFLGLHYPATDIPPQARALYRRNYLRVIVDVDAAPVVVVPAISPEGARLDLSMSGLRSISPIHLEYLRNMGVKASMSISIIVAGQLWGLIACHHRTPLHLGLETRSTAELYGQMFSYLLEARQRSDEVAYDARAREIHNAIAIAFAKPDALTKNVPEFLVRIADYIAADGIGVYHAGKASLTGITPTRAEFVQLVRFLNTTASSQVFSTHHLADLLPEASDYPMRAAASCRFRFPEFPGTTSCFSGRRSKKPLLGLEYRRKFMTWARTEYVSLHARALKPGKNRSVSKRSAGPEVNFVPPKNFGLL
jgi:light-regulated signal transduction histidine kinase (bacteriophytochrome)